MQECFLSLELNEALESIKELKVPSPFLSRVISYLLGFSFEQKNPPLLYGLIVKGIQTNVFSPSDLENGLDIVFENLPEYVKDVPKADTLIMEACALFLIEKLLTFSKFEALLVSLDSQKLDPFKLGVSVLLGLKKSSEENLSSKLKEEKFNLKKLLSAEKQKDFMKFLKAEKLDNFVSFLE